MVTKEKGQPHWIALSEVGKCFSRSVCGSVVVSKNDAYSVHLLVDSATIPQLPV